MGRRDDEPLEELMGVTPTSRRGVPRRGGRRLTVDRRWRPAVTAGVLSALYLLVSVHQPLGVNAYAPHDDTHFMRQAQALIAGDWLGLFNQMTLIKGPGFSFFLALNHFLGTPLTLLLALVFLASCLAVVQSLGRAGLTNPWVRVCLLAVLLFQPAVMPVQVIRDSLYHSLFMFVLAGMITMLSANRPRWRFARTAVWGLVFGLFWITREEGIWVVPALAVVAVARAWELRGDRSARVPAAAATLIFLVTAALPTVATSAINQHEYDTYAVQDFKSAPFQGTMKALDGIDSGQDLPQVPVPASAMELAYQASPTFRTLRPKFEGIETKGYLTMSCSAVEATCGSFIGGLFPWALRDAVAYAGHYTSPTDAARFYDRVTAEIDAACRRGDFKCRTSPLPLVPVLDSQMLRQIPSSVLDAIVMTAYGDGAYRPTGPSQGSPEEIAQFTDLVGNPPRTDSEAEGYSAEATGWAQVKASLASVYAVVQPLLLVLGFVAFVIALGQLVRRRRPDRVFLLVAVVAWILYLTRIALVALIDASSFPAITPSYLEPAFLVGCVAAATSIAAALSTRQAVATVSPFASDDEHLVPSPTPPDQGATS